MIELSPTAQVAAEQLCREVAAAQAEVLGSDHTDTLRSQMNLAGALSPGTQTQHTSLGVLHVLHELVC